MDVATISLQDAGIRKAAILVASLDQAAADVLLRRLGPERADLVRQAVAYLDEIEAEERQRIIDEFRRIGPMVPEPVALGHRVGQAAGPHRWGRHSCLPLAGRQECLPPPAMARRRSTSCATPRTKNWRSLLGGERPPTVALVLSNLPPERAGEVLARLAPAVQIEVVRRLVDLDNTDPETLGEIEQALEARWLRQFAVERRRAAGPEAVAKILAACDPDVRGRILDNLAAHDQPLAEQFGDRPIAFEDIAQFDDAVLLAVYRAAEPEVVRRRSWERRRRCWSGCCAVCRGKKRNVCVTSWLIPVRSASATSKRPGGRLPRWRNRYRATVPRKPPPENSRWRACTPIRVCQTRDSRR